MFDRVLCPELQEAADNLVQTVAGLHMLVRIAAEIGLPEDEARAIEEGYDRYRHRLELLQNAIIALAALESDHYPALPKITVFGDVYERMAGQIDIVEAALHKIEIIERTETHV